MQGLTVSKISNSLLIWKLFNVRLENLSHLGTHHLPAWHQQKAKGILNSTLWIFQSFFKNWFCLKILALVHMGMKADRRYITRRKITMLNQVPSHCLPLHVNFFFQLDVAASMLSCVLPGSTLHFNASTNHHYIATTNCTTALKMMLLSKGWIDVSHDHRAY